MSAILTILFIHQLILFLIGKKPNSLACGLWCYSGRETADPYKLKILALYNESRGEHSTGMCVDNAVIKDVVPAKEFLKKHSEAFDFGFNITDKRVLGHCRAATAYYSKEKLLYAHPHEIDIDGKPFLKLVHNGTITNTQDLGKKYDLDHFDKSDSMLIAEIIAKNWNINDMSILREYDGSATVVFYSVKEKNTLYIHADFLRDLYWWQENEHSCYISSMENSLVAIGGAPEQIHKFNHGVLVKMVAGKVMKTWDLKAKNPYKAPRPASKYDPRTAHFACSTTTKQTKSKKDGFYWENHLIYFNGHLYTGEFYVSNKGSKVRPMIKGEETPDYTHYYSICGVIMKDFKAFTNLQAKCLRQDQFSVEAFKQLLSSEIQIFAKYPVLGKIFSSNNQEKIFWSDQLVPKAGKYEDGLSWTPPLSGMEFTVNRAGVLTSSKAVTVNLESKSAEEAMAELIDRRVISGNHYKTNGELYKEYATAKNLGVGPENFQFSQDLVRVFEKSNIIPKADIVRLKNLIWSDNEYADYEGGAFWSLEHHLDETLKEYQEALASQLSYEDIKKQDFDDSSNYEIDTYSEAPDENDSDFFGSQNFRNEVLFGDYDNIQQLDKNYIVSENAEAIRKTFYIEIGRILKGVGVISTTVMNDILKGINENNKTTLDKFYKSFKEEKAVNSIKKVFENTDVNEGFSNLYNRYTVLQGKMALSTKEELEFEITKLGLKYISATAKSFNRTELLKKFNISTQEIDSVCL